MAWFDNLMDKLPFYFKENDTYKDSQGRGVLERFLQICSTYFGELKNTYIDDFLFKVIPIPQEVTNTQGVDIFRRKILAELLWYYLGEMPWLNPNQANFQFIQGVYSHEIDVEINTLTTQYNQKFKLPIFNTDSSIQFNHNNLVQYLINGGYIDSNNALSVISIEPPMDTQMSVVSIYGSQDSIMCRLQNGLLISILQSSSIVNDTVVTLVEPQIPGMDGIWRHTVKVSIPQSGTSSTALNATPQDFELYIDNNSSEDLQIDSVEGLRKMLLDNGVTNESTSISASVILQPPNPNYAVDRVWANPITQDWLQTKTISGIYLTFNQPSLYTVTYNLTVVKEPEAPAESTLYGDWERALVYAIRLYQIRGTKQFYKCLLQLYGLKLLEIMDPTDDGDSSPIVIPKYDSINPIINQYYRYDQGIRYDKSMFCDICLTVTMKIGIPPNLWPITQAGQEQYMTRLLMALNKYRPLYVTEFSKDNITIEEL